MSIKHVVLDIGDVLIEVDWKTTINELGLALSDELLSLRESPLYDQFERDKVSSDHFFTELKTQYSLNHSMAEIESAWNASIGNEIKGVGDLIQTYQNKVSFYALSNSNRPHIEKGCQHYPLFFGFKKIFTSYEFACRKPEAEIFQKLLGALCVSPQEVLFVDDKIENVEGARSQGLHAEQCYRSAKTLQSIFAKYL